jgi:hypothetical protein
MLYRATKATKSCEWCKKPSKDVYLWHHNTHHIDIQHNDIQHNDTQHNDIQHNDTQHNDIQHNNKYNMTLSIITNRM